MFSYKNNVHLEGNLGKDAEKKTTPNGDVVNFSIAVNEEWKDKDGNEHKNTDWFQIQVWGPLGGCKTFCVNDLFDSGKQREEIVWGLMGN